MPVRSRSLGQLTSLTDGVATNVFTVPAGRTAVVHHFTIVNRSGAVGDGRLRVRSPAGAGTDIASATLAHGQTLTTPTESLALSPGWSLEVVRNGGGGSVWHVYAAGSLLDGEPV